MRDHLRLVSQLLRLCERIRSRQPFVYYATPAYQYQYKPTSGPRPEVLRETWPAQTSCLAVPHRPTLEPAHAVHYLVANQQLATPTAEL